MNVIERAVAVNSFFDGYKLLFSEYTSVNESKTQGAINSFIQTSIDDVVFAIMVKEKPLLNTYEIPMFSSFEDCTINMCIALDSINGEGIELMELGELLLQRHAKEGALYKYGESHFKMAQILGLACKKNSKGRTTAAITKIGKYYLSNAGEREKIITRLLLRSKIMQRLIKESLQDKYVVSDCMRSLSGKTINRRIPNVKKCVSELSKTQEYDFNKMIENLDFSFVEIV